MYSVTLADDLAFYMAMPHLLLSQCACFRSFIVSTDDGRFSTHPKPRPGLPPPPLFPHTRRDEKLHRLWTVMQPDTHCGISLMQLHMFVSVRARLHNIMRMRIHRPFTFTSRDMKEAVMLIALPRAHLALSLSFSSLFKSG
ncbi:hypothetical protein RRG08_035023 [Elysia crispata]|uniref:Uncharacterized protein n=1 Tax=Elysia crispata TaxID=231223 RepID=A0AAE0ZS49_9GAST|nr:hypothetical protein RRG08_035023 [Elysia crispata]